MRCQGCGHVAEAHPVPDRRRSCTECSCGGYGSPLKALLWAVAERLLDLLHRR